MMDEHLLSVVAVRTLEVWLLSMGFEPSGDDSVLVTDYGPHRVWTVQAHVNAGVIADRDLLLEQLHQYLQQQAQLPGTVKFHPYSVELYFSPYMGTYIFASIYHTA